mgnify:CR=1 FL=1
MNLNTQQTLLRIELDLRHKPELLVACQAVVRFLSEHRAEDLQQITFGLIGRVANLPLIETIPVAEYLSSARGRIFDRRFMLIVDEEEFEIPLEDVAEARLLNRLCHPDTGEVISNFEESLFVYFELSDIGKMLTRTFD